MMIVDSDVFIDFFRGKASAERTLSSLDFVQMSIITYYELLQGIRDKTELKELKAFLKEWGIAPIQFDEHQALHCRLLMEKYCLSHRLKMADAMIASCCVSKTETLVTGNYKHFQFITEISCHKYPRL